jgi:ketosteroid isomerase-like protein
MTVRVAVLAAVGIITALTGVRSLAAQPADLSPKAREVWQAELAFARTMADRDHAAFGTFVAEEGVFIGEKRTLRGRTQVAEGWKPFYEGPKAPFSWEPEQVVVLESGTLALSTGPVRGPDGERVGTFSSIWRLEPDGRWRVIFDKGCPPCPCP